MGSSHLSHEVCVAHHIHLLGSRFGHRHKEHVNARLSGQNRSLLHVIRGPTVDKHHDDPWVTSPYAVIRIEEVPHGVQYGLTCEKSNNSNLRWSAY